MLLIKLALVSMAGIMSPGPDFIAVTYASMSKTKRQAYMLAMGIALGNAFWAGVALLGGSILFNSFPMLETGFKVVGSLFLLYFASLLMKSSRQPIDAIKESNIDANVFVGFLITLFNAKAALFYISILSVIVPKDSDIFTPLAAILLVVSISIIWFSIVIFILSKPHALNVYKKYKMAIEVTFSIFLIAYSVSIINTLFQQYLSS